MNKQFNTKPLLYLLTELFFFIAFGLLITALWNFPLKLGRFVFICSSVGLTAIVLFNLLKFYGKWYFSIALVILTVLFTPLVFKPPTIPGLLHQSMWYILTGILVSFFYKLIFQDRAKNHWLITLLTWTAIFTLLFLVMFVFNALIFKYRHDKAFIDPLRTAVRSLMIGPLLGTGVGIGHIVSDLLFKRK